MYNILNACPTKLSAFWVWTVVETCWVNCSCFCKDCVWCREWFFEQERCLFFFNESHIEKLTTFDSKKQTQQKKKLLTHQRHKHLIPTATSPQVMHNFSDVTQDWATENILSKVFNFSITSKSISTETKITAILHLTNNTANEIRPNVAIIAEQPNRLLPT